MKRTIKRTMTQKIIAELNRSTQQFVSGTAQIIAHGNGEGTPAFSTFNECQVEIAVYGTDCRYSVGRMKSAAYNARCNLVMTMAEMIVGRGYPPTSWIHRREVAYPAPELVQEFDHCTNFMEAYVDAELGGGFLLKGYCPCEGNVTIRFFPRGKEFLKPFSVASLVEKRKHITLSRTVMPPPSTRSSWQTAYRKYPLPNTSFQLDQDFSLA